MVDVATWLKTIYIITVFKECLMLSQELCEAILFVSFKGNFTEFIVVSYLSISP